MVRPWDERGDVWTPSAGHRCAGLDVTGGQGFVNALVVGKARFRNFLFWIKVLRESSHCIED
jgi:hypothetical protein